MKVDIEVVDRDTKCPIKNAFVFVGLSDFEGNTVGLDSTRFMTNESGKFVLECNMLKQEEYDAFFLKVTKVGYESFFKELRSVDSTFCHRIELVEW